MSFQNTNLSPHLSYIFQHHVAVAVKSPNMAQKLFVVTAVDEHLAANRWQVRNIMKDIKKGNSTKI